MDETLAGFAAALMEKRGCAVERGPGWLDALLLPEAAAALGLGGEARLYLEPAEAPPGAAVLTLNSELLDRLGALLGERGRFLVRRLPAARIKPGLGERAAQKLDLANATARPAAEGPAAASYFLLVCRYAAAAEEKREGTVHAAVDEAACRPLPDFPGPQQFADLPAGAAGAAPAAAGWAALAEAARLVAGELADFRARLERRAERDAARLKEYFGALAGQVRQKILRRGLQGAEREREIGKIAAVNGEYAARLRDLALRCAVEVRIECVAGLRLEGEGALLELELRRRAATRRLALRWNPVLRRLDEPACDACGRGGWSFACCDARVHLLCPACRGRAGPRECPACAGG